MLLLHMLPTHVAVMIVAMLRIRDMPSLLLATRRLNKSYLKTLINEGCINEYFLHNFINNLNAKELVDDMKILMSMVDSSAGLCDKKTLMALYDRCQNDGDACMISIYGASTHDELVLTWVPDAMMKFLLKFAEFQPDYTIRRCSSRITRKLLSWYVPAILSVYANIAARLLVSSTRVTVLETLSSDSHLIVLGQLFKFVDVTYHRDPLYRQEIDARRSIYSSVKSALQDVLRSACTYELDKYLKIATEVMGEDSEKLTPEDVNIIDISMGEDSAECLNSLRKILMSSVYRYKSSNDEDLARAVLKLGRDRDSIDIMSLVFDMNFWLLDVTKELSAKLLINIVRRHPEMSGDVLATLLSSLLLNDEVEDDQKGENEYSTNRSRATQIGLLMAVFEVTLGVTSITFGIRGSRSYNDQMYDVESRLFGYVSKELEHLSKHKRAHFMRGIDGICVFIANALATDPPHHNTRLYDVADRLMKAFVETNDEVLVCMGIERLGRVVRPQYLEFIIFSSFETSRQMTKSLLAYALYERKDWSLRDMIRTMYYGIMHHALHVSEDAFWEFLDSAVVFDDDVDTIVLKDLKTLLFLMQQVQSIKVYSRVFRAFQRCIAAEVDPETVRSAFQDRLVYNENDEQ